MNICKTVIVLDFLVGVGGSGVCMVANGKLFLFAVGWKMYWNGVFFFLSELQVMKVAPA
jgi:hypothetical protein